MDDEPELKGWELKGVRYYANGLLILALANVVFLFDPPPTNVWLMINGFAVALFMIGAYLTRKVRK